MPTSAGIAALWSKFKSRPTEQVRNALMEHYLPLVERSARRLRMRLPACIDVEDLVGFGVFGLVEAIDAYDVGRNIQFTTFSARRIRGAMVDELRTMDWLPRQVRAAARRQAEIDAHFRALHGRPASDEELADRLHMKPSTFRELARHARASEMRSLERRVMHGDGQASSLPIDVRTVSPARSAQWRLIKDVILRGLNRQERLLITLYYYEDMTMHEIGQTLGISESRISQLHGVILKRLRTKLQPPKPRTTAAA
jgi:RNA polymerase sigma factor for flagellar operon FliA